MVLRHTLHCQCISGKNHSAILSTSLKGETEWVRRSSLQVKFFMNGLAIANIYSHHHGWWRKCFLSSLKTSSYIFVQFFFLVQKCPVYNQFINPATLTLQSKILSLLLYRQYGDARLGDVDDDCILGCVAKTVCAENEQLKFFNTVNLSDQDLKITEVGHLKLSISWKKYNHRSV